MLKHNLFGDPLDKADEIRRALGPRQSPIMNRLQDTRKHSFDIGGLNECGVPFAELLVRYHNCFWAMSDRKMVSVKVPKSKVKLSLARHWTRLWFPRTTLQAKESIELRPLFHPKSDKQIEPAELLHMMTHATWLHRKGWFKSFAFWLKYGKGGRSHISTLMGGGYKEHSEKKSIEGKVNWI